MIDYENPSPETLKEWEKEYRNKCRREMRQSFPTVSLEVLGVLETSIDTVRISDRIIFCYTSQI